MYIVCADYCVLQRRVAYWKGVLHSARLWYILLHVENTAREAWDTQGCYGTGLS